MTRAEAESLITLGLYGFPGEAHDTAVGTLLAGALLEEMGLRALTDEAVLRLAALHQQENGRVVASGSRRAR